jgi:hypothetical protein
MARISKYREEELWTHFDNWTRGWDYQRLVNVFSGKDPDTFHSFLFYLECKTDWFDWRDMEQLLSLLQEYVTTQSFLRTNKTNLK